MRVVQQELTLEPMTGIEPASSRWQREALPLSYISMVETPPSSQVRLDGITVELIGIEPITFWMRAPLLALPAAIIDSY